MNQREFLIERQKGIGGSDVAAIMRVSPWKTPLDVYLEKTYPIPEEDNFENLDDKPQLSRGRKLEKYILEEYAEQTSQELEPGRLVKHPKYPFLQGHVDAFVKGNEGILVEAKSAIGHPSSWEDEIPLYYKTQVAFYAMISDCKKVDVAVIFDRWKYGCFTYHRDSDFEEEILNACLNFWNENVLKEISPNPINLKDVQLLYPTSETTSCQVTKGIQQDVDILSRILRTKKKLVEREEILKIRIMEHMKNNEVLLYGNTPIATWKTQKRSMLDMDLFKDENPAIYNKYKKDQTTRVFRLK